jgi:hypothetical protein
LHYRSGHPVPSASPRSRDDDDDDDDDDDEEDDVLVRVARVTRA